MNRSEFLDRITNVTQWSRKGERAPHKPLLLLLVLARCARGEGREVAYREIDQPLFDLLRGVWAEPQEHASRVSVLASAERWDLGCPRCGAAGASDEQQRMSVGGELKRVNPLAGLTEDVYDTLRGDPGLLAEAVQRILDANFPRTLHEDILAAVGYEPGMPTLHDPENEARCRIPRARPARLRAPLRRMRIRRAGWVRSTWRSRRRTSNGTRPTVRTSNRTG
jgi:putative restriction endonuclease